MKTKTVSYGRSIEVGRFGNGRRSGRVWFGWEVELEGDETEEQAMQSMRERADEQEKAEREMFEKREMYVRT